MNRFQVIVGITVALLGYGFVALSVSVADTATTQPATEEQQLQTWWEDLAGPDPQMTRAVLSFSTRPQQTAALFKEKLVPLILSEDDLNKLITDLGSDDDAVWKPAFDKLKHFDPRLAKDVNTLMADVTEPVARARLIGLLSGRDADAFVGKNVQLESSGGGHYQFVIRTMNSTQSWSVETDVSQLNSYGEKKGWTRAMRAVVLLEHFGTPDAIVILKDMATGNPDAGPTKAAQEALTRLGFPAN